MASVDLYKTTTEERGAEEKIQFSWKKPKVTNQALKKSTEQNGIYFRNETQLQHSAPWEYTQYFQRTPKKKSWSSNSLT